MPERSAQPRRSGDVCGEVTAALDSEGQAEGTGLRRQEASAGEGRAHERGEWPWPGRRAALSGRALWGLAGDRAGKFHEDAGKLLTVWEGSGSREGVSQRGVCRMN